MCFNPCSIYPLCGILITFYVKKYIAVLARCFNPGLVCGKPLAVPVSVKQVYYSPSCSALAWYSCWSEFSNWGGSGERTLVVSTAALTCYRYATQPKKPMDAHLQASSKHILFNGCDAICMSNDMTYVVQSVNWKNVNGLAGVFWHHSTYESTVLASNCQHISWVSQCKNNGDGHQNTEVVWFIVA